MPQGILYNRYKIWGHLLFWVGSIALFSFIFYLYEDKMHFNLIAKSIVTNLGFAIAVYINLFFLIPKILKQKNYIFYIFWLIVLLTGTSLLIQLMFMFPVKRLLGIHDQFNSFDSSLHSAYFFVTLIYVATTSFLKFITEWLSLQDLNYKVAKIEQQKLEAELKTLKGQLNPHFLFNSLNNIYSLALIKSEKVPDLILKLSDLMRHIIYESRENFISIEKEIEFVDNFIALQKIRTSENTRIEYEIEGEIPSGRIAPLLFEPFIDNAFKHGLPGTTESDFIRIRFDFTEAPYLSFHQSNNYLTDVQKDRKNSGIGIENVKQRLKHLYKENEYKLDIAKDEQFYSVQLKLKLKE